MAKGFKVCKVCGKEYEYCNTVTSDRFRWQDVACCKEHAMEYFALVAAARSEDKSPAKKDEQEPALEVSNDAERIDVEEEEEPVTKVRSTKRKRH